MKTFKQLCTCNLIINVVITLLLITMTITGVIYSIDTKPTTLNLSLVQLFLVIIVVIVKIVLVLNKYNVICKELTDIVGTELEAKDCKDFKISTYIAVRERYLLVRLEITGNLKQECYSKCCILANDYLGQIEAIIGKSFVLNMVVDK